MSAEHSPEEVIDLTGPASEQPQTPGVEAASENPASFPQAVGQTALSPFRRFAVDRPAPALGQPGTYSGGYSAA